MRMFKHAMRLAAAFITLLFSGLCVFAGGFGSFFAAILWISGREMDTDRIVLGFLAAVIGIVIMSFVGPLMEWAERG